MKIKLFPLGKTVALLVVFFSSTIQSNAHNDGVKMGYLAELKSKYFLLDQNGKVLKELNCIYAAPFSEGLALIRKPSAPNSIGAMPNFPTGDENSVFIDVNGNEIKSPEFRRANPFSDGVTWAEAGLFNHFLMDKTGKQIAKVNDDWLVDDFSEGMAPVWLQKEEHRGQLIDPALLSNRWGFIDKTGKLVIPFDFTYANGFHQGAAAVRDKKGRWHLIDKKGKQLGEKYDDVFNVSDGMAKFQVSTKYGYLDNQGTVVIQPNFADARDFGEGLAAVKIDDKIGFIDKTGKQKIAPQFLDALKFSEGLCPVQMAGKKWGFIDPTGKLVIQATFEEALPFSGERALVQVGDSIAFIDKTGKFVVAPKYDTASSFRNDRTIVSLGSPEERSKTKARLEEWKKRVAEAKAKNKTSDSNAQNENQPSFIELSNKPGVQSTFPRGLSPDGKYFLEKIFIIFTKSGHPTDKLILTKTSEEERLQEYSADFEAAPIKNINLDQTRIEDYSWAPDSKNFVYAASDNLFFCNAETNQRVKWDDRHLKSYNLCQYSPDGRFIAVGGAQGDKWSSKHELMIIDAKTKKIVLHPEIYAPASIAWSPDSSKIAVRVGPECLKILDVKNNFAQLNLIQKDFGDIAFSPDAKYLASSKFNGIDIFDTKGNLIENHPLNQVCNITWTADSKEILYTTDLLKNISCQTLKLNLQPVTKPTEMESSPSSSNEPFITTLPKFGVIDSKGTIIIPFDYFSIKQTSNSDFEVGLFDKDNPKMSPAAIELFDKTGKNKKITTPNGLLPVQIAGETLVVRMDERVSPEIKGKEIFGLCDLKGNILVEPNYENLAFANEKCILLSDQNGKVDIFDNKGIKTGSIPEGYFIHYLPGRFRKLQLQKDLIPVVSKDFQTRKLCDFHGKFAGDFDKSSHVEDSSDKSEKIDIPAGYASFQALSNGLIIASKPSQANFSPFDWKSKSRNSRTDKRELFYGLLKDYDLIGMPKQKFFGLLGTPTHPNDSIEKDFVSYTLKATGCINEHVWFVVEFENDKLKRWRVAQGMFNDKPEWISENVIYEDLPSTTDERSKWLSPTEGRKVIPKYKR